MRYTPFESFDRVMDQLRRDVYELQQGLSASWPDVPEFHLGTALDLAEHDDAHVLTVDMPGFERDEIDLRYHEGTLWLTAEHATDDETGSRRRSMRERVTVGHDIDVEGIDASYHNGVLEVHLPVVEGAADAGHRIDVE